MPLTVNHNGLKKEEFYNRSIDTSQHLKCQDTKMQEHRYTPNWTEEVLSKKATPL